MDQVKQAFLKTMTSEEQEEFVKFCLKSLGTCTATKLLFDHFHDRLQNVEEKLDRLRRNEEEY